MLNVRQSAGTGAPVLLIHGGICSNAFESLLPVTALRSYRLISYRRRAYEEDPGTPFPVTVPQDAADAAHLLDRLQIEAAHVAGHSHGALVALELARSHPQRVLSLTLLEAGLTAAVPSAPLATPLVGPIVQQYVGGDPTGALHALSHVIFGVSGPDGTLAAAGDRHRNLLDARATFESDLPSQGLWDYPAAAAAVRQPVLSILGGLSDSQFERTLGFAAVSEARDLLDRCLPHCRHAVLPGLNHLLQMADPDLVGRTIAEFLRSLDTRRAQ